MLISSSIRTCEGFVKVLRQDGQYKYPCCDAEMGCQVGKTCVPPFIPTSAGGFIGPLKQINHFPLPGLYTSHPFSPHFPFWFYSQSVYCKRGVGLCMCIVHAFACVYKSTCVAWVCAYNLYVYLCMDIRVPLIEYACTYAYGCMRLAAQSTTSAGCFSCSLSLVL